VTLIFDLADAVLGIGIFLLGQFPLRDDTGRKSRASNEGGDWE
jgi:hypothetical protein